MSSARISTPVQISGNDREQAQLDNLADQLRTVHFTLLALCLVLLAATLQEHRNPFPRALDDLKAIIGFEENHNLGKTILQRVELFDAQKFQMGRPLFVRIKVKGKEEFYKLTFDAPWAYQDYHESSVAAQFLSLDFRSLRDFADFWNHNKEQRVYMIRKIQQPGEIEARETTNVHNRKGPIQQLVFTLDLRNWTSTVPAEKVSSQDTQKAQRAPVLPLSAEWEKDQLVLRAFDLNQLSSADFEIRPHVVPLSRGIVDLQRMLRSAAGKTNDWVLSDFTTTFADLNQAAAKLSAMPLRDLQQELNRQSTDEEVRNSDQLEIFGAKIPVKQISNWGIVLLVGAQCYLWLYLNALRRLVQGSDLGLSMSWIGLHEGLSARGFVVFSVLILPIAVVGVLVYRGWTANNLVRILDTACVIGSLLLISLISSNLKIIWSASGKSDSALPTKV